MPYSFRRVYEIIGPWRIAWLILAATLASVYLGPSVEPFSGHVDTCAFYLFLFCGIILIPLSVITFFLWMFTGTVPALPRVFSGRNKDDIPKVTRTVSVSEDRLATMENCCSRGIAFWQTVVFPVLISMVIFGWAGRYYDYMNWRDPNDYGFYLYPILFAALGIPWHLLYTRGGRRCPYCLTPRTTDNFDVKHHVCLRCHTRFVVQRENDPHFPAPADSQSAAPLP
jgi:hypothetical protein